MRTKTRSSSLSAAAAAKLPLAAAAPSIFSYCCTVFLTNSFSNHFFIFFLNPPFFKAANSALSAAVRRRPQTRAWRRSSSKPPAPRTGRTWSARWTLCARCSTRASFSSTMPLMTAGRCASLWSGKWKLLIGIIRNWVFDHFFPFLVFLQHRRRRALWARPRRRLYPHGEGLLHLCAADLRGPRVHSLAVHCPPWYEGRERVLKWKVYKKFNFFILFNSRKTSSASPERAIASSWSTLALPGASTPRRNCRWCSARRSLPPPRWSTLRRLASPPTCKRV